MDDAKIRQLIRWKDTDAEALAAQTLESVRKIKAEGKLVGIVTCVVTGTDEGNIYDVGFSKLPVEVVQWAAIQIGKKVHEC